MTLDAVIRHLENLATAARHMALAHELRGNDEQSAACDDAAEWFDHQIADLVFSGFTTAA